MRILFLTAACSLLTSFLGAPFLSAQDAEKQTPSDRWNDFYVERIAQYELISGDSDDNPFQLRAGPLLTYTNPVRGRDQRGSVFAWTRGGRPELLGTIWSIRAPDNQTIRRTSHEVTSLARTAVQVECPALADPNATRANPLSWNLDPGQQSLSLALNASRAPAGSKPRRMVQMRTIASELTAVSIDRKDGSERALRLMRSPLLRYESPGNGVIDGGLFAFALATDPELLVLVEAMNEAGADGQSGWRVTPARFTGTEVRLQHQKTEIWRCGQIKYGDQTGPYRLRVGVSELPGS